MVEINIWNDFNNESKENYYKKVQKICTLLFDNINFYSFLELRCPKLEKESLLEFLSKQNPYDKFEISDINLKVFLNNFCIEDQDIVILKRTINSIYLSINKIEESKKREVAYLRNNSCFNLLTCETCGEIDKNLIPVEFANVGVNIAPFHVGCRCSVSLVLNNDYKPSENLRELNDPITLTKISMPESTSYTEWKESLISIHGKKAFYFHKKMWDQSIYSFSHDNFLEFYKNNNGQKIDSYSFNYHQLELIANEIYFDNDEKFIEILTIASNLAHPKKAASLNRTIGKRWLKVKKYDKAKFYLEEALRLDKNIGVKRTLNRLYKLEE